MNRLDIKRIAAKNGSMIVMLAMAILVGMGEKMAERFLPLYLIALGGSTWSVGFLNAMDNLLSAFYSFPGGFLADKLGPKKSLQLFTAIAIFGYSLVILIHSWIAVLIGAVFFISWTAVSLPAIMSLVSTAVPKNRRSFGVSLHSFVRRIPMALGPIIGGLLIGAYGRVQGVRMAFGAAIVMGIVAMILVQRFMDDSTETEKKNESKSRAFPDLFSKSLRNLLVSDILIRFAEQIPYAFVVIWAVDNNHLTPLQFGILTTIEMVTAMLVYIPVARMADKYGKKRFVLITFGFFTAFPLVLLFSHSFWMFVIAFIIRGLKEFGEPTRKALIMDLAPEDAKARTFGAYYLVRDTIVTLAALSSAWLWNRSPATNFLTAVFFGVAGTAYFALFGKDVHIGETVSGADQ